MELRWYQKEAVESFFDSLCNKPGNPVICLPTGSGKSLVIAEITRRAVEQFAGRVLILQHRKELIEQNREKVQRLLPIKVGSYSAGLRKYETEEDVVLCGIQSVYDKATLFGRRHLVLVDESHLVPTRDEGMYRQFLNDLRGFNPNLRCGGLTATPFRTGEGLICRPDGIFNHVCFDAPIGQLIEQGYLCKVTNKPTQWHADTSGLHKRGGEFIAKEVDGLFGGDKTEIACREVVENAAGRHSCLLFCSGIENAIQAQGWIEKLTNELCGMVDGSTPELERAATIRAFRNLGLRWLVNVDVLTTGFDAPVIDLIAILRATDSPGLFAQIVGRGLRTDPTKTDCLVLDFGENIKRHGPIDALDYGRRNSGKKSDGDNEAPLKMCPSCEEEVAVAVRVCSCGFEFPGREAKFGEQSDTESKILSEPEYFEVKSAHFAVHQKRNDENARPTMRVDYTCVRDDGNMDETISEWVCIEHDGFALKKAKAWWDSHSQYEFPPSVEAAVEWARLGCVGVPKSIKAQKEGRFWRILSQEIEELPIVTLEEVGDEEVPF